MDMVRCDLMYLQWRPRYDKSAQAPRFTVPKLLSPPMICPGGGVVAIPGPRGQVSLPTEVRKIAGSRAGVVACTLLG